MRHLLLALLASCSLAAVADPVCEVAAVQGRAELVGGGPLKKGQGLMVGAQLRTGAGARVRLHCVDGSSLVLADNSQLQIELFEPGPARRASFLLSLGLLGQKVQPAEQPAESRWQVRTPSAVTAVRGTEFMVEVARDQSTQVHVLSGVVAVEAQERATPFGGAFQSKSIETRGIHPPASVLLDAEGASTHCGRHEGCQAAGNASPAELKKLRDRLGSF
jgi:hypothetical protein